MTRPTMNTVALLSFFQQNGIEDEKLFFFLLWE
jgi:hypothetical protein